MRALPEIVFEDPLGLGQVGATGRGPSCVDWPFDSEQRGGPSPWSSQARARTTLKIEIYVEGPLGLGPV